MKNIKQLKPTKSIFVILIFLSLSIKSYTQNVQWFIKGNVGISKIYLPPNEVNNFFYPDDNFSYLSSLSWKFSGLIQIRLYKNILFETGISTITFNNYEKRNFENSSVENGVVNSGTIKYVQKIQTSYLGLPISLKVKVDKLSCSIGMETMYFLTGKYNHEYFYSGSLYDGIDDIKEKGKIKYQKYDYGILVGLSFDINKFLSINADLYYGLKNVLQEEFFLSVQLINLERYNRQLTVGLSYCL